MSAEEIKKRMTYEVVDYPSVELRALSGELEKVEAMLDKLELELTTIGEEQYKYFERGDYEKSSFYNVEMQKLAEQSSNLQSKMLQIQKKINEIVIIAAEADSLLKRSFFGEIDTPEA